MPHIPKAFCADCLIEMVVEKTGVSILTVTKGIANPEEPGKPQPYYKIASDKHICPECGHSILTGMGRGAEVEHYMHGFKDIRTDVECRFSDHKTDRGYSVGKMAALYKFLLDSRASVYWEMMADSSKPQYDGEYGETEVCTVQLPWHPKGLMAEDLSVALDMARKVPRPPAMTFEGLGDLTQL